MTPYDEAHALARAIRTCDEVKAYLDIRDKVMQDPSKKEMLDNFARQQAELEMARVQGKEPDKEKLEQLRKLYDILRLSPQIADYLDRENRLIRMMGDINRIIGETLQEVLEPK